MQPSLIQVSHTYITCSQLIQNQIHTTTLQKQITTDCKISKIFSKKQDIYIQ